MTKMEDFLRSWISIVITSAIVLIISFLFIHKRLKYGKKKTTEDYSNCENPNCVRCCTYSNVLSCAKNKLSQFIAINGGDVSYNSQIFRRVQSSLDKVHSVKISSLTDQNPEVFLLKGLETSPWWSIDDIADEFKHDILNLQQHYNKILKEMIFVWEEKRSLWVNNNTPNGRWSVFHLINQGKILKEKTSLCPVTYRSILEMKCVMRNNVFGNAAFSVIEPSTRISKHYGPSNIRLRCHLGIYG